MSALFEAVEENAWKKRWLWIVGAVITLAAGLIWYFSWYGHNPRVDSKVSEIAGAAQTAERRADAVMGSTRQKEAIAREAARKRIDALPDDAVCGVLADLLAQSRRKE